MTKTTTRDEMVRYVFILAFLLVKVKGYTVQGGYYPGGAVGGIGRTAGGIEGAAGGIGRAAGGIGGYGKRYTNIEGSYAGGVGGGLGLVGKLKFGSFSCRNEKCFCVKVLE